MKTHLNAFYYVGVEMDSDTEDEEDAEMSVIDRLLNLVARVTGLKRTPMEVEDSRTQSASKSIYVVRALSLSRGTF